MRTAEAGIKAVWKLTRERVELTPMSETLNTLKCHMYKYDEGCFDVTFQLLNRLKFATCVVSGTLETVERSNLKFPNVTVLVLRLILYNAWITFVSPGTLIYKLICMAQEYVCILSFTEVRY